MYLCSYISIFILHEIHHVIVILCYAHEMTLHLIRVNMNWSKKIIRLLLQIDEFFPLFLCKTCNFLSVFATHITDPIFIFLHLMHFCVPLLKGYLENTEKIESRD